MISLNRAIEIAANVHSGQKDNAGESYVLHPLRVMISVSNYGLDAMICAVLHDVFEDSIISKRTEKTVKLKLNEYDELTQYQKDSLLALTRFSNESYYEYILRVKENNLAVLVKIKDLEDNLDVRRLMKKGLGQYDLDRLNRYLTALNMLLE